MYELRVNNGDDRRNVAAILAEAGYAVYVEKRLRFNTYSDYDYFIIITGEPSFPRYKKDE